MWKGSVQNVKEAEIENEETENEEILGEIVTETREAEVEIEIEEIQVENMAISTRIKEVVIMTKTDLSTKTIIIARKVIMEMEIARGNLSMKKRKRTVDHHCPGLMI